MGLVSYQRRSGVWVWVAAFDEKASKGPLSVLLEIWLHYHYRWVSVEVAGHGNVY